MRKKILSVITAGAAACLLLASCSGTSQEAKGSKTTPGKAVPVTAAVAETKAVPREITTFGTVRAYASIPVRSEVSGVMTRAHFRKGQKIRAGDLLFTIDPRPYRAALDQVQANLLRDRAQEENARLNASRSKELVKRGFIAQSDDDKAQAEARALTAVIRADEAAISSAKLQLEHCSIRSPINGRAGDLLVSEGTLIKANDVPLVTINQMQPAEVFFSIPQADLPAIRQNMARGQLPVRAGIPKDSRPPELGTLFFIDNAIDRSTGTVQVAARFRNAQEFLWPGQYVNVTLVLSVQLDAVVVPSVAVQTGREGKFVFVIGPDKTAVVRPVTARLTAGPETVIEKGLQAGEQVVTDGQLRLVPGANVEIRKDGNKSPGSPGGRS